MLLTLHSYMLRDLLKTFFLSVVTLTSIFIFAGGLYNSIKHEGVGPADLFNVLPYLLPIAVTYTMPISALFAATMTYGRLAADNEFLACRAAGINIHWLFAPALLLAVVVTVFTLFATNILIPASTREIMLYARQNVRDIAFQKLRQSGYVDYTPQGGNRYLLTAQAVRDVSDGALIKQGFAPSSEANRYMWVDSPVFLWIDREERLNRYAVAEGGLCQFTRDGDDVLLTLIIHNARDLEAGRTATMIRDQRIGPVPLPIPFKLKPSMVDMATLLRWRQQPWLAPNLKKQFEELHAAFRIYQIYREMEQQLVEGKAIEMQDTDGNRYEVTADRIDVSVTASNAGLRLYDLELLRSIPNYERPIRVLAPRGQVKIGPDAEGLLVASMEFTSDGNAAVVEYNPRAAEYEKPLPKDNYVTPELMLSAALVDRVQSPSVSDLMNNPQQHENEQLEAKREVAQKQLTRLRRKVMGEFHGRLGFAGSSLVTVLMAAILGTMFRGSRALVAFGLACIPFLITLILIVIGKQQIEKLDTVMVGAIILWGGMAGLAILDTVMLQVGVRR